MKLRFGVAALIILAWGSIGLTGAARAQTAIPLVVTTCGSATMVVGSGGSPTVDTHGNSCTNGTGGGGGPVTMAAGAVAAGAYVAGSLVDGAITTLGLEADAAWSGSGSGTAIAIWKAIYAAIQNGVGATGAAVPADAIYMGINSAGNLVGWDGTVGNAQASTTSGQKGPLTQCAVTTAAPTYTTSQTDPLSCDTAGNLRTTTMLAANSSVNVAQVNGVTTLTGAGATGTGSQRVTAAQDTTTIAGSAPGTAGTASANVLTVQGIASMTKLLVTPDSVALPANQSVNVSQVNGVTTLTGAGATGTGSQRVTAAQDTTTIAGSAPGTAGTPSTNVVSIQGVSSGTVVPVSGTVTANNAVNVTPTDCSGTITSGGSAQNAFTAQTTLHGFTIVNIDTTEALWISFTTTAAASGSGSYPLQAATATTFAGAGSFTAPPGFGLNHALSVIAATTSHKFTCTYW